MVIKSQGGEGDEGLEVGVTTTPPQRADMNRSEYCAATVMPNWLSSDSGSLWKSGRPLYGEGQWATTRPTALKPGDVVALTVLANGTLTVHCNGVLQARWASADVPTDRPLYAIVGMRAPLKAVLLRQRVPCTGALLPAGPRTISLRGIEGRPGEAIDLSKHGRPRYPGAFANVRYLSDVRSLYPLLLQPGAGRAHGRKDAQPVLIRAGPGTGKTWCINQLAYFLARGWRALPTAQRLPVLLHGAARRGTHLARGLARHAARHSLTPCVLYVQQLAREMRRHAAANGGGALPTTRLLQLYLAAEAREGALDAATHAMLLQLFEMRALILLVDGVDEAADLKEIIEDYVTRELVREGHPLVVTSRPEGVRLRLYARDFVVMNLQPLTQQQQGAAIQMQLRGSEFFERLSKFSAIRTRHDDVYTADAFPVAADREALERFALPDLLVLGPGLGFDPKMRNRNRDAGPIARRAGAPVSAQLTALSAALTPAALAAVDAALAAPSPESLADGHAHLAAMLGAALPRLPPAQLEVCVRLAELLRARRQPGGGSLEPPGAEGRRGSKRARGQEETPEAQGGHEAVTAPPLLSAAELWREIVARTDEVYEVAEEAAPRFEAAVRALFRSLGEDPEARVGAGKAFRPGAMKDPVRLHGKAASDYAARFDDGALPEACVVDVVRGLGVFTNSARFLRMAEALKQGFIMLPTDGDGGGGGGGGGGAVRLELVRAKNKFRLLDPTHFRQLQFNVAVHWERDDGSAARFLCELQVHHRFILAHNEQSAAQLHYEFFRAQLRDYEADLSTLTLTLPSNPNPSP